MIIAYDGTDFYGWQRTPPLPTIEESLEKALTEILGDVPFLQAASRTDRGVHAEGQVVTFSTEKKLESKQLLRRLTALLPDSIAIKSFTEISGHFHPTLDALSKEYIYTIDSNAVDNPLLGKYAWHFAYPLLLAKMRAAGDQICALDDFALFGEKSEGIKLYSITIIENRGIIKIALHGNRFLYKMVRKIVGKLAYIGAGKTSSIQDPAIIAPAHGLTLSRILY